MPGNSSTNGGLDMSTNMSFPSPLGIIAVLRVRVAVSHAAAWKDAWMPCMSYRCCPLVTATIWWWWQRRLKRWKNKKKHSMSSLFHGYFMVISINGGNVGTLELRGKLWSLFCPMFPGFHTIRQWALVLLDQCLISRLVPTKHSWQKRLLTVCLLWEILVVYGCFWLKTSDRMKRIKARAQCGVTGIRCPKMTGRTASTWCSSLAWCCGTLGVG